MARVFSGIQPTGSIHIGNLVGAIRYWVEDQDTHDGIYCIVDLHAVTVPREAAELRSDTLALATALFAAGIDAERSIAVRSEPRRRPSQRARLAPQLRDVDGRVRRMTQFKEKSGGQDSVSVGLFDYPVLQAADVLLYQGELVPVGDDQRQHLELMRDIAIRFNTRYGRTFTVPQASIPRIGARIMDLQRPDRKMSKSADGDAGVLWLDDDLSRTRKKIMSAVTDSGSEVRVAPDKPGISALLDLMAAIEGVPIGELEERFAGTGYGTFKKAVADVVVAYLEPIKQRQSDLSADPGEVERLLRVGADRCRERALPTIAAAKRAMGFLGS